jgi:hypothetical protein
MNNVSAAAVTRRALVLAAAGLWVAGCSSSPGTGPAPNASPSAPAASAGAAATESPPPGDIPDSTAYVPYRPASGQYEVKVPEGWARTSSAATASFTDKLNSITVQVVKATAAPTVASARAREVQQIQAAEHGVTLTDVGTVMRSAGTVVVIRYSADSQPDPVTGKVYKNSIERYEYYRNGAEAIVTLTAPAGADNVDPWRKVTDSFRWLR